MSLILPQIVTRFAPSPTGFMHVGSLRTALYAWAFAKKHKGIFILRIEDTDKAREVAGSVEHIVQSLRWLGINWDEGIEVGGKHEPYVQSERLEIYKRYAKILVENGYAYQDPYTEEEIDTLRKAAEEKKEIFLYRNYRPQITGGWDEVKPLRFKVPDIRPYTWNDAVRGELSAKEDALDDFVLIKGDGYPTYNFAHIIDDYEMKVTHIMRADEFIASTPKFLSLYEALNINPPIFVTLPPILGEEGTKKLGKRDGAKDILDYKKEGYLPEALLNFLVLLGWNPGGDIEIFSKEEFVEIFSIERIHKGGAMLDEEKLLWFNKEHIKRLSPETQLEWTIEYMGEYPESLLRRLLPTIIERISVFGELALIKDSEFGFFIKQPTYNGVTLEWKEQEKAGAIVHLEEVLNLLLESDFGSTLNIKETIMPYADIQGRGAVLWPLRMALSGQEKSVDPFTICYVLGYDEVKNRITEAIKVLNM